MNWMLERIFQVGPMIEMWNNDTYDDRFVHYKLPENIKKRIKEDSYCPYVEKALRHLNIPSAELTEKCLSKGRCSLKDTVYRYTTIIRKPNPCCDLMICKFWETVEVKLDSFIIERDAKKAKVTKETKKEIKGNDLNVK